MSVGRTVFLLVSLGSIPCQFQNPRGCLHSLVHDPFFHLRNQQHNSFISVSDSGSPISCFHLWGHLWFYQAQPANLGKSLHFRIPNIITSEKFLLPCTVTDSQVPEIRNWTTLYYSATFVCNKLIPLLCKYNGTSYVLFSEELIKLSLKSCLWFRNLGNLVLEEYLVGTVPEINRQQGIF